MGASPDGLLKFVIERKCIDIGQALSIEQKCLEGRRGSGFPGLRYRFGALFHSTSGRRLLTSPPPLRSISQTTKPLQSLARCRTPHYSFAISTLWPALILPSRIKTPLFCMSKISRSSVLLPADKTTWHHWRHFSCW